jgi:hypothetical protein
MASGSVPPDGLYLHGVLKGGKVNPGRERPGGDGKYPDRYHLSVAVGDDTYRVEYADEAAARAAVESENGAVSIGDRVTIPIGARAGARGGADAFIFWYGVGQRADTEPLAW